MAIFVKAGGKTNGIGERESCEIQIQSLGLQAETGPGQLAQQRAAPQLATGSQYMLMHELGIQLE